ncbi:MAG: hypothetical protein WCK35_21775 [Chloroflexota bacterium]
METQALSQLLDLSVVILANLTNLLLAVMFLLRGAGTPQAGNRFGWAAVVLGIPLAAAAALNAAGGRPGWTIVLPALMVAYNVVEFLLDFILKFDFRHSRWLGPYLGLFYLAQMGLIGYGFAVGRVYGYITLATYFVCLATTAWSYAQVKHG